MRAGTLLVAVLAAALCLGVATGGAAQPVAAKATATRTCSVTGLRYTQKQEGVTLGVAVANLKAKEVACPKARALAATVAKDILHETNVPARIAGLKVTVKEPCTGCTPDYGVIAKSGPELVTFTVKGGA
jgi:hypothetical protein